MKTVTTVLDAGCGNGDFSQGLASSGYKLYGIDLNTSAVEVARSRNIGTFAVASVYDDLLDSFPIQQVDAVIAVEVIEHLYNPRLFVSRISEALAPNGLLIVTTPYWGYLKNVVLALLNRTDKVLTALWDGGHIKHFSRKTLTALMKEQGFEVVGFEGCGAGIRAFTPYLWIGMLMVFRKSTTQFLTSEPRNSATAPSTVSMDTNAASPDSPRTDGGSAIQKVAGHYRPSTGTPL